MPGSLLSPSSLLFTAKVASFQPGFDPYDRAYACPGSMVEIHCCLEGVESMQWARFDATVSFSWQNIDEFLPRYGYEGYYMEEENQTLVIRDVEGPRGRHDNTLYRCTARGFDLEGNETKLEHVVQLRLAGTFSNVRISYVFATCTYTVSRRLQNELRQVNV